MPNLRFVVRRTPPRPCSVDGGETIGDVSEWSGVGTGSLTRHRLNHLNRAVREVRIDETRTAADVLVTLVDTMADVERIREDAIRRGNHSAALPASAESRALARIVFSELNVESTELATTIRDLQALTRGVSAWVREQPAVGLVLAKYLDPIDPRMAREFRNISALAREGKSMQEAAA